MKTLVKRALGPLLHLAGRRVFVGLSGGVDSAVTAALLQKAGAEVTAVFIKGWYPPGMPCTWQSDRQDAMRVAARLHLPFITLDASEAYKTAVIDYLIREYKAGRTPNPDIMCNKEVKFGAFFEFAKEQGADLIATGHYAKTESERFLLRGVDEAKDQSYFLWAVSQEALLCTFFPLGDLKKSETRELAQYFNVPVATKHDSQGICFLGSVSVEDFLQKEIHPVEGVAKDTTGTIVGKHHGAVLSTLGQRVALTNAPPGPWYVIKKDLTENVLVVSHENVRQEHRTYIQISDVNLFVTPSPDEEVEAQYRYHGPRIRGYFNAGTLRFSPTDPVTDAIAPGQSLVLYRGEECLGGGIIG